jgi:hypothetical protein
MDLQNIYNDIYIGDPLLLFLTSAPERFGIVNSKEVLDALNRGESPAINYLIDELPHLKKGYALKDSLRLLMNLYIDLNLKTIWGINKIAPDAYMNDFFGGTLPASYYIYTQDTKISIVEALQQGLINHAPNTYKASKIPRTSSWPKRYIYRIIDVNTISSNDLDNETQRYLNSGIIQQELYLEYLMIKDSRDQFEDILHLPNELALYREYIAPIDIKEPE